MTARWSAGVYVLVGLLMAAVLPTAVGTPVAQAAPMTIKGTIGCINSPSPVGVWVQAQGSKSGWAARRVPIQLGGHSKVEYSYTLNNGGAYQVHVGCGGTPQKWAYNVKSDWVTGPRNFICNDIQPFTLAAFATVARRIFGFTPNLSQGVPFNKCNAV